MHINITRYTHEKNWLYRVNFEIMAVTDIFNVPVSAQFLLKRKNAEMSTGLFGQDVF